MSGYLWCSAHSLELSLHPILRGAGGGESTAKASFITIIFNVHPTLALTSQNKRIHPPTAFEANTQLEGCLWEGGSTKDSWWVTHPSPP